MNHLEKFSVSISGSLSRQKVQDGVAVKYYRNNFTVDGKIYSVANPEDLQGLDCVVQFVKKGESIPGGGTVAQDAFSLVSVTSIQGLRNALDVVKLKREREALG